MKSQVFLSFFSEREHKLIGGVSAVVVSRADLG